MPISIFAKKRKWNISSTYQESSARALTGGLAREEPPPRTCGSSLVTIRTSKWTSPCPLLEASLTKASISMMPSRTMARSTSTSSACLPVLQRCSAWEQSILTWWTARSSSFTTPQARSSNGRVPTRRNSTASLPNTRRCAMTSTLSTRSLPRSMRSAPASRWKTAWRR